MTTITRSQLRAAIEAGITAAQDAEDFTAAHALALRAVGDTATRVARGTYLALDDEPGDFVRCPMSVAFPDWPELGWRGLFVTAYDRASWQAVGHGADVRVLHITEDNDEGLAA